MVRVVEVELGDVWGVSRARRLTSVPALNAYLARIGRAGRPGIGALRELLRQLDPTHAARSTLEVKTRRLLTENGILHELTTTMTAA